MNELPITEAVRNADEVADRFLEGKHIPGVVYAVVAGGELVHVRGIGTLRVGEEAPPKADSVFRIASMTKSFTAATILSLRDDALLRLDDPVAAFVPDLADLRGPTTDSPPITIRHLLTMTAGFPTDDPWGDRQQDLDLDAFAALLRAGPSFAWAPGTRFEYSNLGYGILGRVITAVGGSEYRDVVSERILEPLGMTATTFEVDEVAAARLAHGYVWRDGAYVEEPIDGYGALAAMGGIFTSVRDLARWVAGFSDAFPPRDEADGSHPLSRASRREMQQIQVSIPSTETAIAPDESSTVVASGYGFGLFIEQDVRRGRIVGHSGGYPGFGSNMRWQPASGLGVVVLANHRYAPASLLASELLAALAASRAVPPRPLRPAPAVAQARADVERLLEAWDDDLAASIFAMNVDLDEPIALRRAAIDRVREVHGKLVPDPDDSPTSSTAFGMTWWMVGGVGGRVRVEILLSPEPQPKIQKLTILSVPTPSPAIQALADGAVRWINAPSRDDSFGRAGTGPVLATLLDRDAIERSMRAVAARYGTVRLGPATAADSASGGADGMVTYRLIGDRGELSLRLATDPATGEITTLELQTAPVSPPGHAD